MAQLPSAADLGQVNPGSGERPIGQINAEPIGRGIERLGQGIGQIGTGLGELTEAKGRYDFVLAHGGFLSDMIALNEATSHDLNYGPGLDGEGNLSQRYAANAAAIRDKWAASVGDPAMRARFVQNAAPQLAEGQARADNHAFGLYRDHQIAATDTLGEKLGTGAVSTDDPTVHGQAMDAYGNVIDALAGRGMITQDQAVAKKRAFGANLATGLLLQQAETDPLGALNHIRATPGSDAELTERIIQLESSGRSGAVNTAGGLSHAMGLGQFEPGTWLPLIKQLHPEIAQGRSDAELLALRADPNLSREMTGALLAQNRGSLQAQGLEPTGGNLYLSHFLGAGGASAVLKANPNTPVAALLDPKVIAANPSVLAGKTAGSVTQWANDKMGGYAPGEGSIYSFIGPEQRARLEANLLNKLHAKVATDLSDFKQRYEDSVSEAYNTGAATTPLTQEDFVRTYGPDRGASAFQDYQGQLQLGTDVQSVSGLKPEEQDALLRSYEPKPGDGYAAALKRQQILGNAVAQSNAERAKDPGAFAVRFLPAARDSWNTLATTLANPQATDADRNAAARDFVNKTTMEQQRVGIPADQIRVVPQYYVDSIGKSLSDSATSDDPQKRVGLIGQVQQQAAMWGDAWPQVMRQLAPQTQPLVRAIAAGADPVAMTRLLSLGKDEKPAQLLKEQSEVKADALNKSIDQAMAPFLSSLVGRQRDRDYTGYYNLATQLGALYVRDGKSADDAAAQAFKDLIGSRYEFKDSWRMPKSSGVAVDDVQAGTVAARNIIAEGGRTPIPARRFSAFGIQPAVDDMTLGETNRSDSLTKFARDGKWVTAPDNSGLNLAYGDKFVRTENGAPLKLSWSDLAKLGGQQRAAITEAGAGVPQL